MRVCRGLDQRAAGGEGVIGHHHRDARSLERIFGVEALAVGADPIRGTRADGIGAHDHQDRGSRAFRIAHAMHAVCGRRPAAEDHDPQLATGRGESLGHADSVVFVARAVKAHAKRIERETNWAVSSLIRPKTQSMPMSRMSPASAFVDGMVAEGISDPPRFIACPERRLHTAGWALRIGFRCPVSPHWLKRQDSLQPSPSKSHCRNFCQYKFQSVYRQNRWPDKSVGGESIFAYRQTCKSIDK